MVRDTLSKAHAGCISEHIAASILIATGCEVHWPAMMASRHDLSIINGDGKCQKVQVKSASWRNVGGTRLEYLMSTVWMRRDRPYVEGDFDLLAVVAFPDMRMWLIPFEEYARFGSPHTLVVDRRGEAHHEKRRKTQWREMARYEVNYR